MLLPMWARVAIPLAVAAVIFGLGWKVATWRMEGKVARAEDAQRFAEDELARERAAGTACRDDLTAVKLDLERRASDLAAAELAYQEAVAQPPRVVVRWRDRVETIHVKSPECEAGVRELHAELMDAIRAGSVP
jgi:hypothetical protein